MAHLTRFDNNGIELIIDLDTGEAFATQAGYARMSGLSKQAISKRLQGVNQKEAKTAEIPTSQGLRMVNLIPAKLCFKLAMKDNPELAEAMGEAGATVYIHQLAGYKVTSVATPDRLERIMDLPDPWQRFYDKDFCDRVFNWFGAAFYWTYIYSQFTPDEACKINRLNPPREGVRTHKIHQYINPEIKERLKPYIGKLTAVADGAPTREDFILGYARHFGGKDQLRLFK